MATPRDIAVTLLASAWTLAMGDAGRTVAAGRAQRLAQGLVSALESGGLRIVDAAEDDACRHVVRAAARLSTSQRSECAAALWQTLREALAAPDVVERMRREAEGG